MRFVSTKHLFTVLLTGFAAVSLVQAQEQFNFPTAKDLDRAFNDTSKRRSEMMRGEGAATVKGDDKVAESTAQYYVYRLEHAGTYTDPAKNDPARLQKDFESFADDVARAKSDGAKRFASQLAPHFVTCMKQLLNRDIRSEPQKVIIGSMMLPALGRLRQEKSNDYLIELVQDSKIHDAIRINALKALRESMPILPVDDNDDFDSAVLRARLDFDAKNVAALAKYIERPVNLKTVPPEYFPVIRFVRREAIISLAQAGAPAVAALKKKVVVKSAKREYQLEGMVAPTLLRVLTEKLDPPPTLQEKLEAAHGLCSFKAPKMLDYNPDVAIYLVGRTLEELVNDYNQDLTSITADVNKKLPAIGFKTEAKRFAAGLANLAESAKNTSATKANADRLANAFTPIFKTMSTYAPTDPAKFSDAVKTINSMRPKDGLIFKSSKVSVSLQ